MRYHHVRIAGLGLHLPERRVTSAELEARLSPLYNRLHLSTGRLELMSGIHERRFFPPGTRPSDISTRAATDALDRAGIPRASIGCLIHAAVCRDFLEPATATVVHNALELDHACHLFDLSNACLGVANGMVLVAEMIERGSIEAGLVVAGEDGGALVEETIRTLVSRGDITREETKLAFASLTIGAGAAAVVLARERGADDPRPRLLGAVARSDTRHVDLCRGDREEGRAGPLMSTDSEALLHAGNALAAETFSLFLDELDWTRDSIERVVTHQVGSAHRRLLFETLGIPTDRDFPTIGFLGNQGSVSLPASLALAERDGFVRAGHAVALLGIGSGINCVMLGARW